MSLMALDILISTRCNLVQRKALSLSITLS